MSELEDAQKRITQLETELDELRTEHQKLYNDHLNDLAAIATHQRRADGLINLMGGKLRHIEGVVLTTEYAADPDVGHQPGQSPDDLFKRGQLSITRLIRSILHTNHTILEEQ